MRTERAEHDSQGRKRLEQLADEEPLFLTEDGKPYHRSAFYYHWEKLFEAAQKRFKKQERVAFSPHDIRHLRVTRGITKIKQEAKGDKELEEELLDGFWRLMGWHNAQTMEIYTHTMSQRKALLEVMLDEEEDQQRRVLPQREASDDLSGKPQLKESQTLSSQTLPPDDEFSWYEED